MGASVRKSWDQAHVFMNNFRAYYDLGLLNLLLGRPYDSLSLYMQAIQASPTDRTMETSLRRLDSLSVAQKLIAGYAWVRRLLVLGRAVKFQDKACLEQIKNLATAKAPPISGPVVILAGGTSDEVRSEEYQPLLLDGFLGFHGTIIGGGTTTGICGLVGKVQAAHLQAITTIGYVPAHLPAGTEIDLHYREIRSTDGKDFSVLEALQYWCDMISCGISPNQVKLIGINGGKISAFEFRLALMLGARVAAMESSGREAARLFKDPYWGNAKNLLRLSTDANDANEIKSFLT
jgi:pentatricopeptide repeat protein